MTDVVVSGTLDVTQTGAMVVDAPILRYLSPSEARIYPEQTPPSRDPHRIGNVSKRGMGISWSNGGSNTYYVYASFATPHAFSSATVRGCFAQWQGNDTTFDTHCYSDVIRDGLLLPQITTPTDTSQSISTGGVAKFLTLDTTVAAQVGDTILVLFSLDNLDAGTEIVLHALWLEYTA